MSESGSGGGSEREVTPKPPDPTVTRRRVVAGLAGGVLAAMGWGVSRRSQSEGSEPPATPQPSSEAENSTEPAVSVPETDSARQDYSSEQKEQVRSEIAPLLQQVSEVLLTDEGRNGLQLEQYFEDPQRLIDLHNVDISQAGFNYSIESVDDQNEKVKINIATSVIDWKGFSVVRKKDDKSIVSQKVEFRSDEFSPRVDGDLSPMSNEGLPAAIKSAFNVPPEILDSGVFGVGSTINGPNVDAAYRGEGELDGRKYEFSVEQDGPLYSFSIEQIGAAAAEHLSSEWETAETLAEGEAITPEQQRILDEDVPVLREALHTLLTPEAKDTVDLVQALDGDPHDFLMLLDTDYYSLTPFENRDLNNLNVTNYWYHTIVTEEMFHSPGFRLQEVYGQSLTVVRNDDNQVVSADIELRVAPPDPEPGSEQEMALFTESGLKEVSAKYFPDSGLGEWRNTYVSLAPGVDASPNYQVELYTNYENNGQLHEIRLAQDGTAKHRIVSIGK